MWRARDWAISTLLRGVDAGLRWRRLRLLRLRLWRYRHLRQPRLRLLQPRQRSRLGLHCLLSLLRLLLLLRSLRLLLLLLPPLCCLR